MRQTLSISVEEDFCPDLDASSDGIHCFFEARSEEQDTDDEVEASNANVLLKAAR